MSFLTRAISRAFDPPEKREKFTIGDGDNYTVDPRLIQLLRSGEPSLAGVNVDEDSAMGLPAVYACVTLLSETVGTLPLRTVRTKPDGSTERTTSWLDEPSGLDGPTSREFVADLMVSLLLRGNYFAEKVYSVGGDLLYLRAIPPACVGIHVDQGRKLYRVQLDGGKSRDLTDREILHIPGPSKDGVRGMSPISIARHNLGISIAGERSAARLFQNGALMSAIVTPSEDLTPDEAEVVRQTLDSVVAGEANAGSIAVFNKSLSVSQWSVSPEDAQFLESRKHQVSDVARWFRVPPHLIGDASGSTSWGSGLAEQTSAFQKMTLQHWTSRIEARLTRLLPPNLKAEFDYNQLLDGTRAQMIELLVLQAGGAYMTINEARRVQNLPPIEGGDVLLSAQTPAVAA